MPSLNLKNARLVAAPAPVLNAFDHGGDNQTPLKGGASGPVTKEIIEAERVRQGAFDVSVVEH